MEYRAKILYFPQNDDNYERVITGEISRCRQDFWHWLTHWVWTKNEDANPGDNPTQLFPHKFYLKVIADLYQRYGEHLIVVKSRQIMATWISLMYKLHQSLYFPAKNNLIQAQNELDAVKFFTRIDHTYRHLPEFLQHPKCKITTLELKCDHRYGGSYITGMPQGEGHVRGKTASMLTEDEAAFNEYLKGCITAGTPGLGMNGKLVLISTAGFGHFWDLYLDKSGLPDQDQSYFQDSTKNDFQELARGIETWINPNNGFRVLKIHYTADPDKDPERNGAEWFIKAKKRFIGDWSREMEMDPYTSLGKRVYGDEFEEKHIVDDFIIPAHWTRVMALDYGNVVPTAVLWAAISPDNKVYFYREYYQAGLDIDTHCDNIRYAEGWLNRDEGDFKRNWNEIKRFKHNVDVENIRLRIIDPATDHEARKDVPTIYRVFNNSRNNMGFVKAKNSLGAGIAMVKQFLKDRCDKGEPMMYVFRSMKHFIHEIRNYRFQTQSEMVAAKKDLSEKPLDKDDHLMDCLRYLVLSYCLKYFDESFSRESEIPYWEKEDSPKKYGIYVREDGFTTGY